MPRASARQNSAAQAPANKSSADELESFRQAVRRRPVSRQESPDEAESLSLPPAVQFRVMRIAHAHGMAVPEPIFECDAADAMGNGYVTAFVEGETNPRKILREAEFGEARARPAHLDPEHIDTGHRGLPANGWGTGDGR